MRPLAMGLLVLAACAGVQLPKDQLKDPAALLFNGYVREEINCWHCHNGDGQGSGRGPSLAKRVPRRSKQHLVDVVLGGDGIMPKFQKKLSTEEVDQLVEWLQTSFPAAQAMPK